MFAVRSFRNQRAVSNEKNSKTKVALYARLHTHTHHLPEPMARRSPNPTEECDITDMAATLHIAISFTTSDRGSRRQH